jgi:23S rRNA (pseudouridine1915-N3)-methyltransferase
MAKFQLIHLSTAKEPWAELVCDLYSKKISHFTPFEMVHLKPKKLSRDSDQQKQQLESETILKYLTSDDFVILFDERGKALPSKDFAKTIDRAQQSGKKRIVFIIGGAYGVSDQIRKQAQAVVSLSPMVMNHLVAQTVALEQIYRAFTILKNIPYHNE